jgi:hypothetical protein
MEAGIYAQAGIDLELGGLLRIVDGRKAVFCIEVLDQGTGLVLVGLPEMIEMRRHNHIFIRVKLPPDGRAQQKENQEETCRSEHENALKSVAPPR